MPSRNLLVNADVDQSRDPSLAPHAASQPNNLLPPTGPIRAKHPPTSSLLTRLLADGHDVHRDRIKAHALEQVLGVGVHIELSALRVLGEVQGRDFGDVLIFALALFFLQFERDAADGAALDALHQVRGVACDLDMEGWGLARQCRGANDQGQRDEEAMSREDVPCCEDASMR